MPQSCHTIAPWRLLLPVLLVAIACRAPGDTDPVEAASCDGDDGPAVDVVVAPYVQSVGPDEAWILWETSEGDGSRVDFGEGRTACGTVLPLIPGDDPAATPGRVHEVHLTGLTPNTTYEYRIRTGATVGETLHFHTAESRDAEGPLRFVAVSDMQIDVDRPDKWRELAQDGVMAHVRGTRGEDLAEEIDGLLVPGDLVGTGWIRDQWLNHFFAPAAELLGQVPIYPAPGNHEGDSPHYFRYFHLPEDGDAEHYYTLDRSNVRVIGLDSNTPHDTDEQLAWLDDVLDRTCGDTTIDFVFAQLHHPFKSELWPIGESDFTGEVVARLEAFSTDCGKPSVHFFGHTHSYSRGASQDHRHLWIDVASAGGALDRWSNTGKIDYPEFTVTQDTWGFVIVEVEAGDTPKFKLERISRGNDDGTVDNVLTDTITVYRDGTPPAAPTPGAAMEPCEEPTLRASAFQDADTQAHQASQWQVATSCAFDAPLVDRWRQRQNIWEGVDLHAGDDLTDEVFPELAPGDSFCWRVRYRDDGLSWSDWSAPTEATVPSCF